MYKVIQYILTWIQVILEVFSIYMYCERKWKPETTTIVLKEIHIILLLCWILLTI